MFGVQTAAETLFFIVHSEYREEYVQSSTKHARLGRQAYRRECRAEAVGSEQT